MIYYTFLHPHVLYAIVHTAAWHQKAMGNHFNWLSLFLNLPFLFFMSAGLNTIDHGERKRKSNPKTFSTTSLSTKYIHIFRMHFLLSVFCVSHLCRDISVVKVRGQNGVHFIYLHAHFV